jgi:hypothetical protein
VNEILSQHGGWLILSIAFGVSVGAAELLGRYRDEPQLAVASLPGFGYLLLNGLISGIAYGLLVYYKDKIFVGLQNDRLLTSIIAGFGSMLVMRSKLFSFKTEGGETFAVGPDVVLSTFLRSVDRRIDRNRSAPRQKLVYDSVKTVRNPSLAASFIITSLASYQNLSDSEKSTLSDIIQKVQGQADLPPQLKLMAICFGLLNVAGEGNFKSLMEQLKEYSDNEAP